MSKKPVLVVMAAGMGSRYGGLKQIDPVGSCGEVILDYSLYDAYEAGFETAVIIIKEAMGADFMETVGKRLANCPLEIRYAYQELDMLPPGFTVPEGRTKPWGTTHAVLCARDAIGDAPFVVLNADDYYGKSAFRVVYHYLTQVADLTRNDYCMVGFQLDKTLTDNGYVTRGVCQRNEAGKLTMVVERKRIEKYPGGVHFTLDDGATWTDLPGDSLVSMNMWGYTHGFLEEIQDLFPRFLSSLTAQNAMTAECLLPTTVEGLLEADKITVQVLQSPDRWYGVTYAEDKPMVVEALAEMTRRGKYPAGGLWTK